MDAEYCIKIVERKETDSCLSKMGISRLNLTVCERVVNKPLRHDCLYYYAIIANDSDACGKLDGERGDECIFRIATAKMSESLCAEIGNIQKRNGCYENIAQLKGVPGLCEKISLNASLRDGCYYYFMQQKRSIEYCHKISSRELKGECLSYMAQKNNNVTICYTINSSSLAIDRCLYDFGVSHNNYTTCINIEDLFLKRSCLAIVAGVT